jgi:hypothetical protein
MESKTENESVEHWKIDVHTVARIIELEEGFLTEAAFELASLRIKSNWTEDREEELLAELYRIGIA